MEFKRIYLYFSSFLGLQVVELLACNKVGIGLFTLVIRHTLRKIVNVSVLNLLASVHAFGHPIAIKLVKIAQSVWKDVNIIG